MFKSLYLCGLFLVLSFVSAHYSNPILTVFAQNKSEKKIEQEAKIIRTEDIKEPHKIALSPEESSRLTQLKIQAEADAQRARASQAEFESFYFQLNLKHKIDMEKWDFNFNSLSWTEKQESKTVEKSKEK